MKLTKKTNAIVIIYELKKLRASLEYRDANKTKRVDIKALIRKKITSEQ